MDDTGHHPAFQAVAADIERRFLDIIKDPEKHTHPNQQELELCCMVTVYGGVSSNLMEAHRILAPLPAYKFPKKCEVERTTRPLTEQDRAAIAEKLKGVDSYTVPKELTKQIAAELGLTAHQVTGFYIGMRERLRRKKG